MSEKRKVIRYLDSAIRVEMDRDNLVAFCTATFPGLGKIESKITVPRKVLIEMCDELVKKYGADDSIG